MLDAEAGTAFEALPTVVVSPVVQRGKNNRKALTNSVAANL
jgi:rubredoxin